MDRVRYYWIVQIAFSFALATLFICSAVFFKQLPDDPWERFFSPLLQIPALMVFLASMRILIRHKRHHEDDWDLLRCYVCGIVLMTIGVLFMLLAHLATVPAS